MTHAATALAWALGASMCCAAMCCAAGGADHQPDDARGESPAAISSSREMLELLGVAERLDQISDDADFPSEGDELLWRLLYAVRRFSLLDLDRWKSDISPDDAMKDAERHRGEVVAWTGIVTGVTVHEPPAEEVERFNLARYYRCQLDLGEGRTPAIVYASTVPKQWQSKETLRERTAVTGIVARLADGPAGPRPVVVAQRVAWFPPTFLGDLAMDVGLFDDLSARPELTAEDRECFYQLLAAVGRTQTRQLLRAVPKEARNASVEPLFNRPRRQRGRLVELTGTARRAVQRLVADRDIVARFGIDHYFEIEIFTDDSQGNPLTFCVRQLPKGFPEGDNITEPVRLAGFFFRKWGYRTPGADAGDAAAPRRQAAPLLIGREPIWVEQPPVDQRFANGVYLALFVALTVVLWLVVLRLNRGDNKFRKQVAGRLAPPPEKSLNEMGLHDEGGPDFRELQ